MSNGKPHLRFNSKAWVERSCAHPIELIGFDYFSDEVLYLGECRLPLELSIQFAGY